MKNKKVLLLCVLGLLIPSTVLGWGHRPIHPGDHVYDAKRWADSAKEYLQMAKEVSQAIKQVQQMTLSIKNLDLSPINNAINVANKYTGPGGISFVNPNTDRSKVASAPETLTKTDVQTVEGMNDYKEKLYTQLATSNKETLEAMQSYSANAAAKRAEADSLLAVKTNEGEMASETAEIQKSNYINGLKASADIDDVKAYGAAIANRIEIENTKYMEIQAERSTGGITHVASGYDPYNPSDEMKAKFEASSKNLGFGTFTGE